MRMETPCQQFLHFRSLDLGFQSVLTLLTKYSAFYCNDKFSHCYMAIKTFLTTVYTISH